MPERSGFIIEKKKGEEEGSKKKGWAGEGNRRSIIKLVIYFAGHVRAVDFLLTIPRFCGSSAGNALRLKDINFLIESAKSCNDFSIGLADPGGDPPTRAEYFQVFPPFFEIIYLGAEIAIPTSC